MKYQIKNTVVIGSGTMGSALAAHLANAGFKVTLLDIVPRELTQKEKDAGLSLEDPIVRNRIVEQGLKNAIGSKPASFFSKNHATRITIGNLDDDFECISNADWVIEAIIENLRIKQQLMQRIDEVRRDDTIISTNTSGISVKAIAEGMSQSFQEHFLGTHFFNPPRYLKLIEIIPGPNTLPEVIEAMNWVSEYRLGKGIVPAKDTPNFIANRFAFGTGSFALDYILNHDYDINEIDAITGPIIGRPKTATFRLIDLVGIDVWRHVGQNLIPEIPHDQWALPYLKSVKVNSIIDKMVENKWLGKKVKQGFYKEVRENGKKEFWTYNFKTGEYDPPRKVRFESVGKAKDIEDLGERLKFLIEDDDKAGKFIRATTFQSLAYASHLIPEVADSPKPIDDAMKWGFANEAGPFEIWDQLGLVETSIQMEAEGFPPAEWVKTMIDSGVTSFYQKDGDQVTGVYNMIQGGYEAIKRSSGVIILPEEKAHGKLIKKNLGASLIDIGDGVACLEFHTKMNLIDEDIITMMNDALDIVDKDFLGLVIGNEAQNFSAGANLFLVVMAAQGSMWDQLEKVVGDLQNVNMRMRYFHKPVVIAPAGLALGGGAEITMHASRVVAFCELYTGLVEIGAGVIPAGGGTKEMLRRIINPPMNTKDVQSLPFLQKVFEQIGLAKVATSAEEARDFAILSEPDRVVMNRDYLISEAKNEAIHMSATGYQPPLPEKIYAAGRDAFGALKVAIYMMLEGGYITAHERLIAEKLGKIMTGGELSAPAWVSEEYILDLERESFLSLCGEQKSQERMWSILNTGRVLRN